MRAFLGLIPTKVKIVVAVIIAAIVLVSGAYWAGKHEAKQEAEVAAREQAVKRIQQMEKDNAEISKLDPARVCVELGGEWVHDRCD